MTIQLSRENLVWSRALAAGLLLAALVILGPVLSPRPAEAVTPEDTFTVDQTIDTPDSNPGDGDCDVSPLVLGFQCTLRAALQEANATTHPDLIRFSIQGGATSVKTINVGGAGFGALPPITQPVIVDGYTQTGASPNTKAVGDDAKLTVELNGASAPVGEDGLQLQNTSNSVIKGLVINRFKRAGIGIRGDSAGDQIAGNLLGTDPTGTLDRGNSEDAVAITGGASENEVGGVNPADRNVLSGNDDTGVYSFQSGFNHIEGNYIGTDITGTKDLGNADGGVFLHDSLGNVVGGSADGAGNVISGNDIIGITMILDSSRNLVAGNRIGTKATGGALKNTDHGIFIGTSDDNFIGDGTVAGSNIIAFNGRDGIMIDSGVRNDSLRNSIFSNGGLGIDLMGPGEDFFSNASTPNDGDNPNTPQVDPDSDSGPNNLQNRPSVSSARKAATGRTTVKGRLNSAPGGIFAIKFFSNPKGANEGKKLLGSKNVTTDSSGSVSFTFSTTKKIATGQNITATATDGSHNTSEFSAPRTVALATGSPLSPETTKVSGPSDTTNNPTVHFKFASTDPQATFECSLDGGTYYECSSPENINGLSEGRHVFAVRAIDEQGNVDPSPAEWIWAVDSKV